MKSITLLLVLILLAPVSHATKQVAVLCYHEVTDNTALISRAGITTDMFIQHLDWLHGNGYQPISIQQWVDASEGGKPLPEKAVLLTFDDGYASFYTRVLPLLKAYNYPSVLALVGEFLQAPLDGFSVYGGEQIPRREFLSWSQLEEIRDSGMVEIASHSFDMHKGALANIQGNIQPEASIHLYLDTEQRYETDQEHRLRISADLKKNSALLQEKLGINPRVMVWPYGSYTGEGLKISKQAGMPITLTLDPKMAGLTPLNQVPRLLVAHDWTTRVLAAEIRSYKKKPQPVRAVHVDLDYVWDPDPIQQEINLGMLLDRIKDLNITTVYLQAYSDIDGDSVADALYFPNKQLPMRSDLFNRTAWQLRTRANVEVFAWLPVLAFDVDNEELGVKAVNPANGEVSVAKTLFRLSPWKAEARQIIFEIYAALTRQAKISGILFSDDAMLADTEDASDEAIAAFNKVSGINANITQILENPEWARAWADYKTEYLIDFTHELVSTLEKYQVKLKTARNIFARPVLDPQSEAWFAQSLPAFIQAYDQVALMAMPYLEQATDKNAWMIRLFERVKAQKNGLKKVIFELQAVDWNQPGRPDIPSREIAKTMRQLQLLGALNFAYYPDDFIRNHPDQVIIHPAFSLEWYPFR